MLKKSEILIYLLQYNSSYCILLYAFLFMLAVNFCGQPTIVLWNVNSCSLKAYKIVIQVRVQFTGKACR